MRQTDDAGNALPPEVQGAEAVTSDFFDRHQFFCELIKAKLKMDRRAVRRYALGLIMANQIECLDAIRSLTVNGRPSQAWAIYRRMYEGYLSAIVIGFYRGPWKKANTNPRTLATRFLGFSYYHLYEDVKCAYSEQFNARLADPATRDSTRALLQTLRRRADLAVKRFGFTDKTTSWHGLGSKKLYETIWPGGHRPCCLYRLVASDRSKDRTVWDQLYFFAYKLASHHVHGSALALANTTRRVPGSDGFISSSRRFEHDPLEHANILATLSLEAIARGLGCFNEWRTAMTATKKEHVISLCEAVPSDGQLFRLSSRRRSAK